VDDAGPVAAGLRADRLELAREQLRIGIVGRQANRDRRVEGDRRLCARDEFDRLIGEDVIAGGDAQPSARAGAAPGDDDGQEEAVRHTAVDAADVEADLPAARVEALLFVVEPDDELARARRRRHPTAHQEHGAVTDRQRRGDGLVEAVRRQRGCHLTPHLRS
jgi:hypothetical protein